MCHVMSCCLVSCHIMWLYLDSGEVDGVADIDGIVTETILVHRRGKVADLIGHK